jgi:type IV pilus assembly protein PilB
MRKQLGAMLLEEDLITKEQLNYAFTIQKDKRERIGNIITELGIINEQQLIKTLSKQLSVPAVCYSDYIPSKDLTSIVPRSIAESKLVFPFELKTNQLKLAMANPLDWETIHNIEFSTGLKIKAAISLEKDILNAIQKFYGTEDEEERWDFLQEMPAFDEVEFIKEEDSELTSSVIDIETAYKCSAAPPVIKLVTTIISNAVKEGASDIHIEPTEKNVQVRNRIDGELKTVLSFPKNIQNAAISRIKIISNLDITNTRLPQDGRSALRLKDRNVDLRISTMPSAFGELVVIRLLDSKSALISLDALGIPPYILKAFTEIFTQPQGMLLVTGPTGSGKTTTLYSVLQQIKTESKNIITLEDPIEYHLAGINQVSINESVGFTFAKALRSVLRQDPDIVMLGEIRDLETAEIGIRAALTGHFVLSTLHTNDTVSTVSRLIDIGLEPFLVTGAVSGIISQRLLRKNCVNCKTEVSPPKKSQRFNLPNLKKYYKGTGCNKCNNTGYKGRIGVYELLRMDKNLKELISSNSNENDLWISARKSGTKALFEDAWLKVEDGTTTLEEVISKIAIPHFLIQEKKSTKNTKIPRIKI